MASTDVVPVRAQSVPSASHLDRLSRLPQATHGSEIVVEPPTRAGATRVWIRANEDDTRLYGPGAAQLDIDFQPAATFRPGETPSEIVLLIESRGGARPGPGPQRLALAADGRAVAFEQREGAPAVSGPLVFRSVEARLSMSEFLDLATASRVTGKVWDIPFELLGSQLELLRAFAARVIAAAAP